MVKSTVVRSSKKDTTLEVDRSAVLMPSASPSSKESHLGPSSLSNAMDIEGVVRSQEPWKEGLNPDKQAASPPSGLLSFIT